MSASSSVAKAQMPTTTSHDALTKPTLGIVADVPDPSPSARVRAADGESALEELQAISADLRGATILDPDGEVLAATGDRDAWRSAARALLEAADAAAGEPVSHMHVATEDGEVFAVRQDGFTLVAAAERFTLAGLMLFDIRSVLRGLARRPGGGARAAAAGPEAEAA